MNIQTTENGSQLLEDCVTAARIAARVVQSRYGIPALSQAEVDDYASELTLRLLDENNGTATEDYSRWYLVQRAQGIILNDHSRFGLDMSDPAPTASQRDCKLTGPLSVPDEIAEAAKRLGLTETGRRALIAAVVPATRDEWANYYGYASADSWKTISKRGRAEIRKLGAETIRAAMRAVKMEFDGLETS